MASEDLHVYLTQGLQGKDDHIDLLSRLFEESQTITVETANPMLDLISFAQDCTHFWVVNASDGAIPPNEAISNEWSSEEHTTNSLGLFPVNPSHSIQPTPSVPEGTDSTLIDPFFVDPECQTHFSDTTLGPSTSNLNTTQQFHPSPSNRWQSYAPYSEDDQDLPAMAKKIAGFIYIVPSSAFPDALRFQEYNIGIILRSEWRGKGVADRALHLALDQVFSGPNVHRVQAQLIDCYKNDKALTLFTRMGFSHEGMRRQGLLCPLTNEWRDVTTLALLVTDWVIHVRDRTHTFRAAPKSLWDALFARHQREREELLRWEDKLPHRISSLDTIRDDAATPIPGISSLGISDASDSDSSIASETEASVSERPKRKLFEIGDGKAEYISDAYDASSSEYDSEYEGAVEGSPPKRLRSRQRDPSSVVTGSGGPEIDGSHLGSPLGNVHSLPDDKNDGHLAGITSPGTSTVCLKTEPEAPLSELLTTSRHALENPGNPAHSTSPSPEIREGSVPPSDSESEFDLEVGYMTSSSTSSSPSGWESSDHSGSKVTRPAGAVAL